MSDDAADALPWDPDPLAIGQRVRVRLSGETPGDLQYPAAFDGARGIVWHVEEPGCSPYLVKLDGRSQRLYRFARVDLERVDG